MILSDRSGVETIADRLEQIIDVTDAVLYAVKEGCFFPVPEPNPKTATARDWVQWGAMRNLHNAIAALKMDRQELAALSRSITRDTGGR